MSVTEAAAKASIGAATRELHLPTVRDQADRLAEIAVRERQTHLGFLAEVLATEVDDRTERRRARRVAEARFPRHNRLSDFNVDAVASINAAQLAGLASGAFMDAGEPIVLLGDSEPARPTCSSALDWPPATKGGASVTSPPPSWSTNSSKQPMTGSCLASSAATAGSTCSAS